MVMFDVIQMMENLGLEFRVRFFPAKDTAFSEATSSREPSDVKSLKYTV